MEITRRARADLIEIGDYLERVAGKRVALKWMERLEAKALDLAVYPFAGAADAELGDRRRVVVRPYLIIYQVEAHSRVRVIRVVHGARDLPALFGED